MVYKRYIKKGGKLYGPYYYESYRDKYGKVKSKFVSGPRKKDLMTRKFRESNPWINLGFLKKSFVFFLFVFLVIFIWVFVSYIKTDRSSDDSNRIVGKSGMGWAEFSFDETNLKIRLDLLDYDKFVERAVEKKWLFGSKSSLNLFLKSFPGFVGRVVKSDKDVETFRIDGLSKELDERNLREISIESKISADSVGAEIYPGLDGSRDGYKLVYRVPLKDLKFFAKIDIVSNETVSQYDGHSLRIGKRKVLSFENLVKEGYKVNIGSPLLEISKESLYNPESNKNLGSFFGFTGRVVSLVEGFFAFYREEESKVTSIYIEKDFTNSFYKIGELVELNPVLIIEVSKVEHLDETREFVEDIYESVKAKDNFWSSFIKPNEFVRVSFHKNLTNKNDITFFARSFDEKPADVLVFLMNDNKTVARFVNISKEGWYKVYLNSLEENESYGSFDLKVIGNSISFDYIVDPESVPGEIWNVSGPSGTAYCVAVDSSSGVYVTGTSSNDYLTIKYNATNGSQIWSSTYNDVNDYAYAVAVDNNDGVYITGNSGPFATGHIRTIKYNATNGSQIWSSLFSSGSMDSGRGIAVDSSGVYVAGDNVNDFVIVKYNATNGFQIWNASYDSDGGSSDVAYAIAIDNNNGVYVVGTFLGGGVYGVVKYNSSGSHQWNSTGGLGTAYGVAVDSSGTYAYVTGTGGTGYYFLEKYNATNGSVIWRVTGGDSGSGRSVALDSFDNVYMAGVVGGNFIIIKYNSSGDYQWNITESTGTAYGVVVDNNGIYVTGDIGGNYFTVKYNLTIDTIPPSITVNSPLQQSYSFSSIDFNVTLNEAGYCLYSLDLGLNNITMGSSDNINFYNSSNLADGSYVVNFYCNDSFGNMNNSVDVSFSVFTSTGVSSGGGSGGGGGFSRNISNRTINETVGCLPNWSCTEWSECLNGLQTRKCSDSNNCNQGVSPEVLRECEFEEFSEDRGDLVCGEWSDCYLNYGLGDLINESVFLSGEKYRVCENVVSFKKEIQRKKCKTRAVVYFKKVFKCNKNYLEVYSQSGELKSSLEFDSVKRKELNINFNLGRSFYCDYCYDRIKNYDEDGVDCSYKENSSCPVC